jgi:hypothetical protein
MKNGVSSIFGPIITLFNYFNESKIELTPFSLTDRAFIGEIEETIRKVLKRKKGTQKSN